ncbi:MAG: tetratricopeptide repeat protein [Bdellovibrionota bacterium]
MLQFRLITKNINIFFHGYIFFALIHCSSTKPSIEEQIAHGSISYPFYRTNPLGKNGKEEKFIIRSAVGESEYSIEIPGAARDYDIEIPLASMDSKAMGGPDRPKNLANPTMTDREMVNALPSVESTNPAEAAFMDKAFGVGRIDGPQQSPSYSLGLAKINRQYKRKNFEYTLIEINNLLAFYPNSPKLHKMKGTVYNKMGNYPMAEKSWIRALELEPRDLALKRAIEKLQRKIKARLVIEQTEKVKMDIPQPISSGSNPQILPPNSQVNRVTETPEN